MLEYLSYITDFQISAFLQEKLSKLLWIIMNSFTQVKIKKNKATTT